NSFALAGVNGRKFRDLHILTGMHSSFNNTHAALESQVCEIAMQDELQGKAGVIGLKHLDASAVCQKQRAFVVVGHSHVLPLLAIVPDQLDQSAVRHKRKLSQQVETPSADDSVVLNGKFQGSGFLVAFIEYVVHPSITHFKREKIGGHANARL